MTSCTSSQSVELNHRMDECQYLPSLMVGETAPFHGAFQADADLAERLR